MLNANPDSERPECDEAAVQRIVQSAAGGALTLVAIATAIVIGTWFAFYLLVFLRRAVTP
jgi:type IV secretory pathway VirB2 component (pilin)